MRFYYVSDTANRRYCLTVADELASTPKEN